jgi:hypothetical protein
MLSKATGGREDLWGTFDVSELSPELEDRIGSQFRDELNKLLQQETTEAPDRSFVQKCEHVAKCFFTAFSPFAKTLLSIAVTGQSVPK